MKEVKRSEMVDIFRSVSDHHQEWYFEEACKLESNQELTGDGVTVTTPLWAIAHVMGYKLID